MLNPFDDCFELHRFFYLFLLLPVHPVKHTHVVELALNDLFLLFELFIEYRIDRVFDFFL